MTPNAFIATYGKDEAERVALAAKTNYAYFSQIAYGHRNASRDLAERLAVESAGRMTELEILFPKRYERAS